MRLSSSSVSKWRKGNPSGSRLRKKHKRLDAISEEAYNQNHGEGNAEGEEAGDDLELRRSSRVRRPPVILDASPAPPRKRQRISKNVAVVAAAGSRSNAEGCSPHAVESPETQGSWRSRLRARGRNAGGRLKESGSPSGKRKLFREIADIKGKGMVVKRELDEKKGKSKRGGLTVVKSKRPGRIKASNGSEDSEKESNGSEESEKAYDVLEDSEKVSDGSEDSDKASYGSDDGEKASAGSEDSDKDSGGSDDGEKASICSEDSDKDSGGSNDGEKASIGSEDSDKDSGGSEDSEKALSGSEEDGDKEIETLGIEDHNEMSQMEVTRNVDEEVMGTLEGGVGVENEKETVDGNATQAAEEGEREAPIGPQLAEDCNGMGNGNIEPMEVDDKLVGKSECVKDGENKEDVVEILTNQAEDRRNPDEEEASLVGLNGKPVEVDNAVKLNSSTRDRLGKPRIKEGRRCGLCGGGTDGKPPKKLVHDTGESENETYSGSSASEEPNYDVWDGFGDEPG